MKKLLILLAIIVVFVAGCGQEKTDLKGEIKKLEWQDGSVVKVLVEGRDKDSRYSGANLEITVRTKVTKEGKEISPNELEEGMKVEANIGNVKESNPIQASAEEIRVE